MYHCIIWIIFICQAGLAAACECTCPLDLEKWPQNTTNSFLLKLLTGCRFGVLGFLATLATLGWSAKLLWIKSTCRHLPTSWLPFLCCQLEVFFLRDLHAFQLLKQKTPKQTHSMYHDSCCIFQTSMSRRSDFKISAHPWLSSWRFKKPKKRSCLAKWMIIGGRWLAVTCKCALYIIMFAILPYPSQQNCLFQSICLYQLQIIAILYKKLQTWDSRDQVTMFTYISPQLRWRHSALNELHGADGTQEEDGWHLLWVARVRNRLYHVISCYIHTGCFDVATKLWGQRLFSFSLQLYCIKGKGSLSDLCVKNRPNMQGHGNCCKLVHCVYLFLSSQTTRAWTASHRKVKIGYATGVLDGLPCIDYIP